MSSSALAKAIHYYLLEPIPAGGAGLSLVECDLTDADGHPPARSGQLFVGVYCGDANNIAEGCVEEEYGASITITSRINEPMDRVGPETINRASIGIDVIADRVRAVLIKKQYAIMDKANEIITSAYNGFVEPLFYKGKTIDRLVGPEWFLSRTSSASPAYCGVVRQLILGGARRIQSIESVQ